MIFFFNVFEKINSLFDVYGYLIKLLFTFVVYSITKDIVMEICLKTGL